MKTLIVSGGNIDILFLEDILKEKDDYIIAVDKGIEALHELNIKPNYIVGDFDSVNKKIIDIYRNENIPIQEHNTEKDYTLAIGRSLGISNEIEDDYADIVLKEGILIVIEAKD